MSESSVAQKITCTTCGAAIHAGETFCHNCGSEIDKSVFGPEASRQSSERGCGQCGRTNPMDAKFCAYCGNPLTAAKSGKPAKANAALTKKAKLQIYAALCVAVAFIFIVSSLNYDKNKLNTSLRKGTLPNDASGVPITSQAPAADPTPAMPITTDKATLDEIDGVMKSFQTEKDFQKKAGLGTELIGLYRKTGRLDQAGDIALELAKEDGKSSDLFVRAANLYDDGKFFAKAIEAYQEALLLNPKNVDARVDMSICYLQTGEMRTAVEQMKQAVEDNPNHQKANLNMGILNAQIGRLDDARKYWQAVIAIDPKSEPATKARELIERYANEK